MNGKHMLSALWTAVAVYSILSFFWGSGGILAFRNLKVERDRLAENMESLEGINRSLSGSMDALRYDADTLSVHAREIGYGAANERFIRILGLSVGIRNPIVAGNLVKPTTVEGIADSTLRILSGIAGLSVFLVLSLRRFGGRKFNG